MGNPYEASRTYLFLQTGSHSAVHFNALFFTELLGVFIAVRDKDATHFPVITSWRSKFLLLGDFIITQIKTYLM